MLTDYHLHLRPDDVSATAADYFSAANVDRYRAVAEERGIAELGCAEHVYRFAQALEVWGHPLWRESANDDIDAYCGFIREETDLRLGIAESQIAVEVSTAGLRKPAGEIYPAPAFLEMCLEAGCPVALSSDAHVPGDIGRDYDDAVALLERLGVGELAVFERRERRLEPIG